MPPATGSASQQPEVAQDKCPGAPTSDKATTNSGKAAQNGVRLRINNEWVHIPAAWMNEHPGGPQLLQHLDGRDATDAFFALHSEEAIQRMMRFHHTPCVKGDVEPTQIALAFRQFRQQLADEGFFTRSKFWDLLSYVVVWSLCIFATYISYSHKFLSMFILAVCMQQSGWLGHDLNHGRGDWCYYAGRFIAGTITGFSPKWWSDKHNTHHCFPNFDGVDQDIANDPIFHLWIPEKNKDVFIRKYQHIYFLPVCSFIYVSWRIQSVQWAWRTKDYPELFWLAIGYAWLLTLPFSVSIGAIFLGGFFVGVVVTATHQSEPLTTKEAEPIYDFCKHQFDSTRNADTSSSYLMYLFWGGMQFQLEHHLFPTMPRYYLRQVAPKVQKFAKENGLDYRMDGVLEILKRNLTTMKHYALSPAVSN